MTVPFAAATLVLVTASLIPAPTTSSTLGVPVILTPDTLEGDGAGSYMSFSSAAEVAAALAASEISSTTAGNLTAALAQTIRPPAIYVVTYGVGVPSDALQIAIDGGLDVGVFMLQSNTESAQETLAVWLSSDSQRKSRYMMIAQSADTGLYGGSKPASLSDLEQLGCRVFYAADTEHLAAAYLAILTGFQLAERPIGARSQILGVGLTPLTASQATNVRANDAGYLAPQDAGSAASRYTLMGTKAYSGDDWSSAVSLIYAARQVRAALSDLWARYEARSWQIPANADGIALASGTAAGPLEEMRAKGHFNVTSTYPQGYRIDGSIATSTDGPYILLDIWLSFAGEAIRIQVAITGEIAA